MKTTQAKHMTIKRETLEDAIELLKSAVFRVEMEHESGGTILKAWANDARLLIHNLKTDLNKAEKGEV